MVWARIDDAILDNRKVASVGVLGFALHIAGITWCCRNLTDGFIPFGRVYSLLNFHGIGEELRAKLLRSGCEADAKQNAAGAQFARSGGEIPAGLSLDPKAVAGCLCDAGLWKEVDGGYAINDFLTYNPQREQVLAERERGKRRAKESKDRRSASPEASAKLRKSFSKASPGPEPVPVPVNPPVPSEQTPTDVSEVEPRKPKPEERYAAAWARGISAATGSPCSSPNTKAGEIQNAVVVHGKGKRGEALLAWVTASAEAYVKAKPSDAGYGGFTPKKWLTWLDSGMPGEPQSVVRLRPGRIVQQDSFGPPCWTPAPIVGEDDEEPWEPKASGGEP